MRVSFLSVSRKCSRASTASEQRDTRSSACVMRMQLEHCAQKSGRPSVTVGARQFIVLASMSARVYFPEPCGPARITACGSRLRASMSRMRLTVSRLPWKSEKGIKSSRQHLALSIQPANILADAGAENKDESATYEFHK